ncbi:hypothetical protein L2735_08705 [Shewanella olleyana]|uniref:hypothetical protein n=1 Tax=Shewanella olleyana TaxID=135626 RepID=UPI00200C579E|nr:hypothetical protein [Shewanella olleyana]MCL1066884.1 hypothetical protein [Shewanella olleyana]
MKLAILLMFSFVHFSSLASDSIAEKICNAYEKDEDKSKCFSELEEAPRYISFEFGGSACPDIKYWEKLIDEVSTDVTPDMKEFDKHCFSLRKGNVVYGFLNKVYYNGSELVQVKSSDGTLLWLETAGVKDVVFSQTEKPKHWLTVLRNQDGKIINATTQR